MSGVRVLHQFVATSTRNDAVYNQAEILQEWLRSRGWTSEIYAENIDLQLTNHVLPYTAFRPTQAREVVILHYSIGSRVLDYLLSQDVRFILIYHNLTPPQFMASTSVHIAHLLEMGIAMLPRFAKRTLLALADSEYNQRDLVRAGFAPTAVLPVPFDEESYRQQPDQAVLDEFADDFVNLLFVGRIAPNKRLEDVIKAFYYYRQINQSARLFLVGAPISDLCPYHYWLKHLIKQLRLDNVYLTGRVPLAELLAYYKLADVYISMSEHEGYGVPLIESMYFNVPVLAYKATAVPETLGQAGVQVGHKDFFLIAELIHQLVTNAALRDGIISQQRQRLSKVSMTRIHRLFDVYIDRALSDP
jgi:glycosyltransferase involved in cell wall biosynthesis